MLLGLIKSVPAVYKQLCLPLKINHKPTYETNFIYQDMNSFKNNYFPFIQVEANIIKNNINFT